MEMDDGCDAPRAAVSATSSILTRSPLTKPRSRSMSDSGGTSSRMSPSPQVAEVSRGTSKDDSSLVGFPPPVTPRRSDLPPSSEMSFPMMMAHRKSTPPPVGVGGAYAKPAPLSPQLDRSNTYASPTNILPRRSRGLDFSRAATSLHHSTLADQSSPESSPTAGGMAMNIPGRRGGFGDGPEQTSTSLWSIMGNQEKMNLSHSLGSTHAVGTDSSSSSENGDLMDEDMDEAFVTTPQVSKMGPSGGFGSPATGSLMSFQQRQRNRKPFGKRPKGPVGLGFNNSAASSISSSPPNNAMLNARRESISWQANQLHISGVEAEENAKSLNDADGTSSDVQGHVVRRAVTRRGNMLPKTKNFARIRAALFEEGSPADTEFKREAEVVKQVWDSDVPDLEPRRPPAQPTSTEAPGGALTALSSPNQESLDDIPEDDMMSDLALGLSGSFKQHAMRNSKGKMFWDTFSESSSVGGTRTTPPPPPLNTAPRGSSSGISDDAAMDSPSQNPTWATLLQARTEFQQRPDSAQGTAPGNQAQPPTAADITRRINTKRRREDDFDPVSFKRRAVSPGLSVHNSPLPQSPLQRDVAPWGSRPGSNGGDRGGSSAASESGSMGGTPGNPPQGGSNPGARANSKGRIGLQGMVDTNDGIMRMSIE